MAYQDEEEYDRHNIEQFRLGKQVEELEKQKNESNDEESIKKISQEIEITKTRQALTDSRLLKAGAHAGQREFELEAEQLKEEFQKATDSAVKMEIQDKLKKVESEINGRKEEVKCQEKHVNKHESRLQNLVTTKERLFRNMRPNL